MASPFEGITNSICLCSRVHSSGIPAPILRRNPDLQARGLARAWILSVARLPGHGVLEASIGADNELQLQGEIGIGLRIATKRGINGSSARLMDLLPFAARTPQHLAA